MEQKVEILDNPRRLNQYLVAIAINTNSISLGCVLGWVSPSLPILISSQTPLDSVLNAEEISWIGSIHMLCAAIGTILCGYLLNFMGRKLAVCLIPVPFIINWIIIILAASPIHVMIARIFCGIGAAAAFTIIPVYIVEIAEMGVRGRLGTLVVNLFYIGVLFTYIICPLISYSIIPYIMLSIPVSSLVLAVIYIPETPYYLMKVGKKEQALKNLRWLRGVKENESPTSGTTKNELDNFLNIQDSKSPAVTYRDYFNRPTLRGFVICFMMIGIQQVSCMFAILTYGSSIFANIVTSMSSNDVTTIFGALLLAGSIISIAVVDRTGRKILLLSSSIFVALSLVGFGSFIYMEYLGYKVGDHTWIPILLLVILVMSYSFGIRPIPTIIASELFTPQVRGAGVTLCTFSFWMFSFLVVKFFNGMAAAIGLHTCFWIIGCCTLAGVLLMLIFVPETKGRNLEDIQAKLLAK